MTSETRQSAQRLVLVTGPSGAGRSTAIRALEDVGFETIDNLPIGLLERLLGTQPLERPMALGLDTRNRDFSPQSLLQALAMMQDIPDVAPELLYLDCEPAVLLRRYSETRRRHPMAPEESPREGIQRELSLLEDIRSRADVLIDTSQMTPHELRAATEQWFGAADEQSLALTVQSFSYKRGLPQGADLVFDCRFLRNPYWNPELRHLDGSDSRVGDYVAEDKNFAPFADRLLELTDLLLPAYVSEGRSHLTIGFGCTGGQHRSVFAAETLSRALALRGWRVSIRHRELKRFATLPGPDPAR